METAFTLGWGDKDCFISRVQQALAGMQDVVVTEHDNGAAVYMSDRASDTEVRRRLPGHRVDSVTDDLGVGRLIVVSEVAP